MHRYRLAGVLHAGGHASLRACTHVLSSPTPRHPPTCRRAPGGPTQVVNGSNLVCDLAARTALQLMGSDGSEPLDGDVLGSSALSKLRAYSAGDVSPPVQTQQVPLQGSGTDGSSWWGLPSGTLVQPLAAPCSPLEAIGASTAELSATKDPTLSPKLVEALKVHRRLLSAPA